MRVVVMVPPGLAPGARLPLLVALHGWGETLRGVERGAFGWSRDYELGASDLALRTAPLAREAFLGHVDDDRFARLRRDLAARPYRGLVVVAPFTPDVLGTDAGALQQSFDRWLVDELVPRARRELPVLADRAATGIDGVSLGGLHSLEIGLAHPEVFGVVGALQPAVRNRLDRVLARYAPSPARPAQRVRLVTSRGDVYRRDVAALDAALRARGVAHDLRVLAGPHDYVFNRGPGGVEMLLFHDRALRGLPAE
jgi:acetyl esterase/lipase